MLRRVVVLLLLILALAIVLTLFLSAVSALLQGEYKAAWEAFWPVFLLPLAFLTFGVVASFHRKQSDNRGRQRQ